MSDEGIRGEPEPAPTEEPSRPKWLLPLIGVLIAALVVANQLGNAFWASWITDRPYQLLALNSSNKYLIGTTPNTAMIAVLVISTIRLMAPDPLFYAIGFLYRSRAIHWARQVFPASGQLFDSFEADKSADPKVSSSRLLDVMVVVVPNNPVCLIAGVAGMNKIRFTVLAVVGTIGRILIMRGIGEIFSDEIESILETVAQYQKWITIVSVSLVVLYALWQMRNRKGLIGGVEDLEGEFGEHDSPAEQ